MPPPAVAEAGQRKPRISVAGGGGGVGGVVLTLVAKRRGSEVQVFEKHPSAVRGEGRHRGPIQLYSNDLAVLHAIDLDVAREIAAGGCLLGHRLNGLADGITGQ